MNRFTAASIDIERGGIGMSIENFPPEFVCFLVADGDFRSGFDCAHQNNPKKLVPKALAIFYVSI
jgi:hypothetical protein